MKPCKKHIIAAGLLFLLPYLGWAQAPVVDDSEQFALFDDQQASESPVVNPQSDAYQNEKPHSQSARNDKYSMDSYPADEEPALAKDDQRKNAENAVTDNANLIEKIQSLQQEVQELRGQLEVQAHDLKLLQQQQIAFYKDLDSRIGAPSTKKASSTPELSLDTKPSPSLQIAPKAHPKPVVALKTPEVTPLSKANPANEQISYMAAYELIKGKRYEEALQAMTVFVQKYPKGGYTANAHYWLGELYLVKKEYTQALEHFDVVLDQFSASSKSAASLLKSGYAYASLGNTQEATKRLEQVVRTYPDTPTAQLARAKLKLIHAV